MLAGLVAGGAVACERAVTEPSGGPASAVTEPTGGVGAIAGRVVSLEGQPVAGASVRTPEGAETRTGSDGSFTLQGLAATSRLPVSVEARGFVSTTAIYRVVGGQTLSREVRVQERAAPVVIDAGAGGVVPFAGGGSVSVPANAFAGVQPGEPVSVQATYLDPADRAQLSTASGDFRAVEADGTPSQLQSAGMIEIIATDAGGAPLDLAPGQAIAVTFPDRDGSAQVPWNLYDFNPATGNWEAVGVAPPNPDGTLEALINSLRLARKNLDVPIRPACIRVRVLTPAKFPRPFTFVALWGITFFSTSSTWTDAQGYATFNVPSPSQVVVQSGPVTQLVNVPAGIVGCPVLSQIVY